MSIANLLILFLSRLADANKEFAVEIRLSKGSFDPDKGPKGSGIALKLRGVPGARTAMREPSPPLAASEADTHDLIFVSTETLPFFVAPGELQPLHDWLMWLVSTGDGSVWRVGVV